LPKSNPEGSEAALGSSDSSKNPAAASQRVWPVEPAEKSAGQSTQAYSSTLFGQCQALAALLALKNRRFPQFLAELPGRAVLDIGPALTKTLSLWERAGEGTPCFWHPLSFDSLAAIFLVPATLPRRFLPNRSNRQNRQSLPVAPSITESRVSRPSAPDCAPPDSQEGTDSCDFHCRR
jgi:hypothetical protein